MTIESRYTLASTLEYGRFGAMYRAVDSLRASSDRDDDVVVWVLPPEFAHHGPARIAFLRDLERVRDLTHPNIARVLDVGQDADRLFVVTEWTDGDTLRNVIDALGSERLEAGEADTIIEDIGSALAYAHDHDIVHGDIRAENITVTSDHRIKVANFMLASLARSTPFAPAPLDDTRALAVLAHELYCGVSPSRDGNARLIREIPRQRRRAIAMAMTAGSAHPLSVTDFLAYAGLTRDGYRLRPRQRPVAAPRFSLWRIALPVAGLAAIGTALQVGVDGTRRPADPSVSSGGGRTGGDETTAVPPAAAVPNEVSSPESNDATPAATANVAVRPAPTVRVEQPPPGEPVAAPQGELAARNTGAPSAAVAAVPAVAPAPASTRSRSTESIERLTLSGYTVTVQENQGTARLDILRTANLGRPLDFVWWTADGTARADDDYASFGARIESFRPNEAARSIYIPLASDAVAEGPESFFVHISADRRVGLERPTVTAEIRIIDDDL